MAVTGLAVRCPPHARCVRVGIWKTPNPTAGMELPSFSGDPGTRGTSHDNGSLPRATPDLQLKAPSGWAGSACRASPTKVGVSRWIPWVADPRRANYWPVAARSRSTANYAGFRTFAVVSCPGQRALGVVGFGGRATTSPRSRALMREDVPWVRRSARCTSASSGPVRYPDLPARSRLRQLPPGDRRAERRCWSSITAAAGPIGGLGQPTMRYAG